MLRASSTTRPSSTTRQSAAIPRSTGMLLAERQRAVSGLLSGIGEHARLRPPQRSPLIGRAEYESERDTGERSVEPATTSPSQGYPWNFLAIPVFALQAKLEIGAVDDPLEHEADRVADQIMRMPDSKPLESTMLSSPSKVHRACAACEEDAEKTLHAKQDSASRPAPTPNIEAAVAALGSLGRPLSQATRDFFEPRFGHDFSEVRVHTDANAAASARTIGARAYTVDHNIVFAPGRYSPDTVAGRKAVSARADAHDTAIPIQPRDGVLAKSASRSSSIDFNRVETELFKPP